MKTPINCPICGDPLLNIFPPAEGIGQPEQITKHCSRRVTHNLAMICDGDDVLSVSIGINSTNQLQARWLFNLKEVWIWEGQSSMPPDLRIPWFEPDFSDYKKLLNKIKTYVVFS